MIWADGLTGAVGQGIQRQRQIADPGFGQKRLGLFDIALDQVLFARIGRRGQNDASRPSGQPVKGTQQNRITVVRILYGLPHPDVLQLRRGYVDRQPSVTRGGHFQKRRPGRQVFLDLLGRRYGKACIVERICLVGQLGRLIIDNNVDFDLAEIRFRAGPVWVGDKGEPSGPAPSFPSGNGPHSAGISVVYFPPTASTAALQTIWPP